MAEQECIHGTVSGWQPRSLAAALTVHSTHPPPTVSLLANSSLSLPLRVPATQGLLSQGAASVPHFSLLAAWFTCVSNTASFYFELLIAHLPSPSSIPQFLVDKAHSGQDLALQSKEGQSGCGEVCEAGTWVGRQAAPQCLPHRSTQAAGAQVLMLRHSRDTLAQL